MVIMNTVGLQAFSTNDKLESFAIMRIGARYELEKVTCQDHAHSLDATCGAFLRHNTLIWRTPTRAMVTMTLCV